MIITLHVAILPLSFEFFNFFWSVCNLASNFSSGRILWVLQWLEAYLLAIKNTQGFLKHCMTFNVQKTYKTYSAVKVNKLFFTSIFFLQKQSKGLLNILYFNFFPCNNVTLEHFCSVCNEKYSSISNHKHLKIVTVSDYRIDYG